MRVSGALRHIEHLASLDLDPHIAIPEMLRTLSGVVPGARADFRWTDAQGAVLDAYVAGGTGVPERAPADGRAELSVSLTASERVRATLTIHRAAPLGERERRLIRAAAPSLRRALANSAPAGERFDDLPERTGVLTITHDGRLAGADRHALLLVAEMDGRPLVGAGVAIAQIGERLPAFIAELCGRHTRAPTILHRTSRWGAYRAQLFAQYRADDMPAHHVVVISKHLPYRIGLMRTIETLDLSPRERQVAFQLGIGADSSEGAAALAVSIVTWRSYVKRVYLRLDVRDRMDLFARLNRPVRPA